MTSKYQDIQYLYNKIKNYKVNELLPTQIQLDKYIEQLLGSQYMFMSESICYKKPFSISKKGLVMGYTHNVIIFVNKGITIVMTNDIIEKIPILRSIIIDGNGADKPLRLKGLYEQQEIDGPLLYLTKLPLDSLYFDKPNEGYDVKRYDTTGYGKPNNSPLEKYFMFDNVEEALINYKWYS